MSSFTDLIKGSQRILIRLLQRGIRTFYDLSDEELVLLNLSGRFPTLSNQLTTAQRADYIALLVSRRESLSALWSPQPVAISIVDRHWGTSQDSVGDESLPVDLLTIPSSKEYKRAHGPRNRSQRVAAYRRQSELIKRLESQRLQDPWNMPPKRKPQGLSSPVIISIQGFDRENNVRLETMIDVLGPAPYNPTIVCVMNKWTNNLFVITDVAWELIQSLPVPPDYKYQPWWTEPTNEDLLLIRHHSPQAYLWVMMHRIQEDRYPNYTVTWATDEEAADMDSWELEHDPYLISFDADCEAEIALKDMNDFHGKASRGREWDRAAIREDMNEKYFQRIGLPEMVRTHRAWTTHMQSLRNYPFIYIFCYLGNIRDANGYHYTKKWAEKIADKAKKAGKGKKKADDSESDLDSDDSIFEGDIDTCDEYFYWNPMDLYEHITGHYSIKAEIAWDMVSLMVKIRSAELKARDFIDVDQFADLLEFLWTSKEDTEGEMVDLAELAFGTKDKTKWIIPHLPSRQATDGYNERVERWIEHRTIELASTNARRHFWDVGVKLDGEGDHAPAQDFKAMGAVASLPTTVLLKSLPDVCWETMFDTKYFTRQLERVKVDGAFVKKPTKFYEDDDPETLAKGQQPLNYNAVAYTTPEVEADMPDGKPAPKDAARRVGSIPKRRGDSAPGGPSKVAKRNTSQTPGSARSPALEGAGAVTEAEKPPAGSDGGNKAKLPKAVREVKQEKGIKVDARPTPHPSQDKSAPWDVGDGDTESNLAPSNGKSQPDLADPGTTSYDVIRYIDGAKASRPPKNCHMSDEDAAALLKECQANRMTLKELNRDYPQTFDTNGAIYVHRRPRGKPAINIYKGQAVYLVAHGNRALIGEGDWLNRADRGLDGAQSQAHITKYMKEPAYIIPSPISTTKWIEDAVKTATKSGGSLAMLSRIPETHKDVFPFREELVRYSTKIDGLRVPLEYVEALQAAASEPDAPIAVRDAAATVMKQRADYPDQIPERFREHTAEGINIDLNEVSTKMFFCGSNALRGMLAAKIACGMEPDLSFPAPAEPSAPEPASSPAPVNVLDRMQFVQNTYESFEAPVQLLRQSQEDFLRMHLFRASSKENYDSAIKGLSAIPTAVRTQVPLLGPLEEDESSALKAPSWSEGTLQNEADIQRWSKMVGGQALPPGLPNYYANNAGEEGNTSVDVDALLSNEQPADEQEDEEPSSNSVKKATTKIAADADID
jgi:hypothetical protein